MAVIPLTLTISLCLVFTFVIFFMREHSRQRFSSAESEALLPLSDETPRTIDRPAVRTADHAHGPDHVCHRNGGCESCVRRTLRESARAAAATSIRSA